jgi:hypothetical protein
MVNMNITLAFAAIVAISVIGQVGIVASLALTLK